MTKIIETRRLSNWGIGQIKKLKPVELQKKWLTGDFLCIDGIVFQEVFYSLESNKSGQSDEVTYWSELYDLEINLNFKEKTTEVCQPSIDWRASGF